MSPVVNRITLIPQHAADGPIDFDVKLGGTGVAGRILPEDAEYAAAAAANDGHTPTRTMAGLTAPTPARQIDESLNSCRASGGGSSMPRVAGLFRGLVVSISLVVAPFAAGDDFPQPTETLPGFKAHGVYEGRSIENLSLFNGDPQLVVPLGPEYPTDAGTSLQLKAYYSTRFWHMYQTLCEDAQHNIVPYDRARVRGLPTLGVGWTLELGTIDPAPTAAQRARYFAQDGGIHEFVDPAVVVMQAPEDGAQIRIQKLDGDGYVVRFPDGTSHWLTHPYTRPDPKTGWGNGFDFTDVDGAAIERRTARWGLAEIRNKVGAVVAVVNWSSAAPWQMTSIRLVGSEQYILFHWINHTPVGQAVPWAVLGSIDFPILTSPALTLTTTMGYSPTGHFQRTVSEGYTSQCEAAAPSDTYLPFLASISQHTDVYSFTYSLGAFGTGLIESYRLPTGLLVSYGYSNATAPLPCLFGTRAACMDLDESAARDTEPNVLEAEDRLLRMQSYLDRAPAVITRTEADPTNAGVSATTYYDRQQYAQPMGPAGDANRLRNPARVLRRVIVRRPSGNGDVWATRYVFHVLTQPVSGWSGEGEEPVTSGPGVEVERSYYSGATAAGAPLRSNVFCYDQAFGSPPYGTYCGALDGTGSIAEYPFGLSHMERSRDVIWYGEPLGGGDCNDLTATGVACHAVQRSGWDPDALEFAVEAITAPGTVPSSILLQAGMRGRQTTTAWYPRSGSTSWQPKLFTSRTVADLYDVCPFANCSVTRSTSFDEVTGLLNSSTVSDGTLSRTTAFTYSNGNPTHETVSGNSLVGTYVTQRSFQGGLVTTSQRTAPSNLGWKQFDVTRDPALGLITASRDPNGLSTTYSWDPLGRLSGIQPPGESPTTVCYGAWNGGAIGAWVLVRKGGTTGCSAGAATPSEGSETAEAYVYDGTGRLSREIRLLPNAPPGGLGGTYLAVRRTERNEVGLVTSVSEWETCGAGTDLSTCFTAQPATKTLYSYFDVFGRPQHIVSADHKNTWKAYDDVGVPASDTREDVTTDDVAGGSVSRATRRDILGRVLIASEPKQGADPALFGPLSLYLWDVHDQLANVEQTRLDEYGASHTQTRIFTRNILGLVTSETHPETGLTTYASFTALGHPQTTTVGGVAVSTAYDALDRVASITSSGQLYVQNAWDGASGTGGGAVKGRLTRRVGFNPGASENAQVEESFTYLGPGGRLSKKTTALRRGTAGTPLLQAVDQNFTWNSMGLLASRTAPAPVGSSAGTVEFRYSAGFPTRILSENDEVVSAATYHLHGALASYTTGNGVVTSITADPDLLARPSRVRSSGATENFDSGTISYDGAGNMLRMCLDQGPCDTFTYDRLSRLKTATWGARLPVVTETFTYDGGGDTATSSAPYLEKGFGSLTRRTLIGDANPGQVELPADPSTNRLLAATYDGRGNLTQWGTDWFFYDALSRRVRHEASSAVKERYIYSGDGERVAKLVSTADIPAASPGPLRFYTLTPCRLLDTRDAQNGAPSLSSQTPRTVTAAGKCGIPADAVSLSLNLTTVSNGVSQGFLGLYPAGLSFRPSASAAVINSTRTRANFGIGTLSATAAFDLFADTPVGQSLDVIVDVSGYFKPASPIPTSGTSWLLTWRDEAKRPAAEYRFDEARPGLVTLERSHAYLGDLRVATHEELARNEAPPGWDYFVSDHLGTPRLRTGAKLSGQTLAPVLETYRYGAFGLRLSGTKANEGREFALMERDEVTGHHYDHARFYSDWPARFLSPDQLLGSPEDPQSWNRYVYARNNPLKYVDPDGKDAVLYIRHSGSGINNFGHVALRVFGKGYDRTYDFGRYGQTTPIGRFKPTGEGILKVWANHKKFEAKQRSAGDLKIVTIQTTDKQDKAAMEHFDEKLKAGTTRTTGSDPSETKLSEGYTLWGNNCTTMSLEGLEAAEKKTGQPIPGLSEIKDAVAPDTLYRDVDGVYPNIVTREKK